MGKDSTRIEVSDRRLSDILEKEREVLREKARLLSEGIVIEYYTEQLCMRIRPTIKQLYMALPVPAKRAAKQAFEAAILAYWLGGEASSKTHLHLAPVVNMNLNIVEARAEARAEASAEAKVDLQALARLLEEILRELELIRNLATFPSQLNAKQIVAKADTLLEKIRRQREKLVFN